MEPHSLNLMNLYFLSLESFTVAAELEEMECVDCHFKWIQLFTHDLSQGCKYYLLLQCYMQEAEVKTAIGCI